MKEISKFDQPAPAVFEPFAGESHRQEETIDPELKKQIEALFLPEDDDFVRALVTDKLPEEEYRERSAKINKILQDLYSEDKFYCDKYQLAEGKNFFTGMSAQTVREFSNKLKEVEIEPWGVAFEEPYRDSGLCFYQSAKPPGDDNSGAVDWRNGKILNVANDELRIIGYFEGWPDNFPHVNLFHVLEIAKKYPNCFFASPHQDLQAIPVPGVQFFRYGYGKNVNLNDANSNSELLDGPTNVSGGWDKHWGDKYNEKYKEKMASDLLMIDSERMLGEIIIDLGCGDNPVSRYLGKEKRQIILVDKSPDIKKKEGEFFQSVCDDFDKINFVALAEEGIDTAILSDILNYSSDWKMLLENLSKSLREGGRMIISNEIDQGYTEFFTKTRPKNNFEIITFLAGSLGFEIENIEDAGQTLGLREKGLPVSRYAQVMIVAVKK